MQIFKSRACAFPYFVCFFSSFSSVTPDWPQCDKEIRVKMHTSWMLATHPSSLPQKGLSGRHQCTRGRSTRHDLPLSVRCLVHWGGMRRGYNNLGTQQAGESIVSSLLIVGHHCLGTFLKDVSILEIKLDTHTCCMWVLNFG